MAPRASTASPARSPASAKAKAVARSRPVAKPETAPAKPAGPFAQVKATGGAKPAAKAVRAPQIPAKPAAPKKAVAASPGKAAKPLRAKVSEEQRRNYIEVAAYYIAERRGFFGTSALEDWTQAEAEVDRMLREGKLNQ